MLVFSKTTIKLKLPIWQTWTHLLLLVGVPFCYFLHVKNTQKKKIKIQQRQKRRSRFRFIGLYSDKADINVKLDEVVRVHIIALNNLSVRHVQGHGHVRQKNEFKEHLSPGLLLLLVFRNSFFHHRPKVPDQSLETQQREDRGKWDINFAWIKAEE